MAKASATIDVTALKIAGESNKYVTYINDEGVRVHEANDTSNYSLVNASGMKVYQGGVSVAQFGSITRIGLEDEASITLSQDSIVGKGLNGLEYFKFQASSNNIETQITDNVVSNEWASSASEPLILICSKFSSGTVNIRIRGMSEEESVETTLLFTYGNAVNSSIAVSIRPSSVEEANIYYSYDGTNQFSFYSPTLKQKNFTASITGNYTQNRLAPGYALGSGNPSGGYSLIEGYQTSATGNYSHAEGYYTEAIGNYSHAEGYHTIATPHSSHAEGYRTKASGEGSHAEGYYTEAIGNYSHTEGSETKAEGVNAHAGGYRTKAFGNNSYALGQGTVVTESNQMAIGQYNYAVRSGDGTSGNPYTYSDAGNYLFIIGNGTGDATSNRKNAFTVDTYGNVNIPSGKKYQINGTALTASDVNAVPTSDVSTTGGTNKVIKSNSSGNVIITGNLTLGGHTTSIGSTLTATNSAQKSISADGSTTLATLSNLPIGTWIIECNIRFSNTANGIRRGGLLASGSSLGTSNMDFQIGAATTAAFVKQTFTKVITTTAITTYNLIGYSSVAVTVGAGGANIKAVRLC